MGKDQNTSRDIMPHLIYKRLIAGLSMQWSQGFDVAFTPRYTLVVLVPQQLNIHLHNFAHGQGL